ncbi:MAG: hypothetical protein KGR48_01460 [Alphaproteobacteria bacterium]|nr:hypothetical protein [Alphaproteobacteria bacterium]MDE2013657.1 hypothetical protein [Alphaproteobacteria bacterium]
MRLVTIALGVAAFGAAYLSPAPQIPARWQAWLQPTAVSPGGTGVHRSASAATSPASGAAVIRPVAEAPAAATQPAPAADPALTAAMARSPVYYIRYDHWSEADERGFGEFLRSLGDSNCHTVNSCLHGPGNPFRASDPVNVVFRSDCADLPYILRAYYAWKRGLPFSYESEVEPRGASRDIRYTPDGNEVTARHDVLSGSTTGYALLETLRDAVSSATYRIHPDGETPLQQDFYSPALRPGSIRPGTVIYDPNGHLATVYRIDPDGRIFYLDAHPDESVTHGSYDMRFVRARPGMGAGFKNWRPQTLVGATRTPDGALTGGHVVLTKNADLKDFSDTQYFGTGPRPAADRDWAAGSFTLNGQALNYYDYVRAMMAGGKLEFDPMKEVAEMVDSNCADLHYRADAVKVAIEAGTENLPEPERLPPNIYGTEGLWEIYSTPSRDARLKTAFKELRDQTGRFIRLYVARDQRLNYRGSDLAADLLRVYDRQTAACKITYTRSDGSEVSFGYEEARRRLFRLSFDPYQCVEHRWGADSPAELATCKDGAVKRAWYAAEQNLRNQIDRTYEARMDFTLGELTTPGPGKGVAAPPDIDVRAYLLSVQGVRRGAPVAQGK